MVLEITERLAPEERQPYQQILRDLKRQGFGVAIDDMGAGYASLQALVEVEPDYLKFDISLVRNIDRNLIKRSLLETLVDLSQKIGAKVIAEGIEAETELAALLDLGVGLGQGRFFTAPELVPGGSRPVTETIPTYHERVPELAGELAERGSLGIMVLDASQHGRRSRTSTAPTPTRRCAGGCSRSWASSGARTSATTTCWPSTRPAACSSSCSWTASGGAATRPRWRT